MLLTGSSPKETADTEGPKDPSTLAVKGVSEAIPVKPVQACLISVPMTLRRVCITFGATIGPTLFRKRQ